MKKIKLMIITILLPTFLTGCLKSNEMENLKIYTTSYPNEYLLKNIFKENKTIDSIYPSGVNINEYEFTDKQIKDYSKTDFFVYNGLTKEKTIAATFLNNNKELKIIDVSKGISIKRDIEELWLCPSNYLMLAQNIKNGLLEYTNSTITKQNINNNYDNLKLLISKYDAELKLIAESSDNPTIIAGNDVFKFLEKYGFKVLSIEDNDLFVASEFNDAKNNVQSGKNKLIFVLTTDSESENINKIKNLGASIVSINSITNLSDEENNQGYDYKQMMDFFLENLKNEVYR